MTPGKVELRIGHVSGSREYMVVEIKDEASRIMIAEIEVPLEEFARIITGQAILDLTANFGDLSLVNKKLETKTEYLPLNYSNFSKYDKIVKPYEVDGWKADKENGINHHRISKAGYAVHFRRWI